MVLIEDIVLEVGKLGRWIQAVGLIVILWMIVQAITLYFNRRRRFLLMSIEERLKRVEDKLDKLIRRK